MNRIGLIIVAVVLAACTTAVGAESKWFVCKYVGTPGVDERLQTGENPISVGGGSLPQPIIVGTFFNDSQGRSFILAEDVGQPEPDPSDCPPPDTGPSPTPPSAPPSESVPPSEPPSAPPSESVPPSESPSAPPSGSPPVVAQFSVEPAACRFAGDDTRLRFRVIAGLILLSQVDIFIDGQLIDRNDIEFDLADREAFIVVQPGLHAWSIVDEDTGLTLASGETLCPTCFNLINPTPRPTGAVVPNTDTAPPPTTPGLPIVLALVAAALIGAPFLIRRRT